MNTVFSILSLISIPILMYHPILFLIGTLMGIGVFYYVVHLIKSDFVKKPLMPKESFWAYGSTTHEVSVSFGLDKKDDEDVSHETK